MEKAWEIQQRICQAFEEYFGSTDPVFSNPHLAEEWMNNFLEWYSYLKYCALTKNTLTIDPHR